MFYISQFLPFVHFYLPIPLPLSTIHLTLYTIHPSIFPYNSHRISIVFLVFFGIFSRFIDFDFAKIGGFI